MPMKTVQRKGLNFEGQNVYIGIDVHKKSWQVAIQTETGYEESFRMSSNHVEELRKHLTTNFPQANYHSVYESGFSGFSTHRELISAGINNIIVNAADVPTMQKEQVTKTDVIDARKLVRALRKKSIEGIYVMTKQEESFRELERHRDSLTEDIGRLKSRIKHLLHRNGIRFEEKFGGSGHWTKAFVKWMKEEIELPQMTKRALDDELDLYLILRKKKLEISLEIRHLMKDEFASEHELLTSVPGIGLITAATLLAEIGNFDRFRNEKTLASYAGLSPTCHSSGEKETKGEITFRCNRRLRRCLIESSWVAIRTDSALSSSFLELRKRMPACNAIIRIARKLLNRVLYVMKNGAIYEKGIN